MKTGSIQGKKYSIMFGAFAAACFVVAFVFHSLGSYVIWIFGGATVYCLFMMIFHLVPPGKKRYSKKVDPNEAANRAYIAYHFPIVISVLLGGLLLALIIVFFA